MSSTISAGTTSGTAIAISGDTSGQLVLQTNGSTTAVTISTGQVVTLAQPLPVASGGSGVTTSTGTGANVLGTSPTLATPVLSGSVTGTYTLAGTPTMGASLITSGTTVASTSGTSIDFTGIPSWVKRITVMLSGVSTNGTSNHLIRLGDSTGFQITGYISMSQYGTSSATDTTGLLVANSIGTAEAQVGFFVITTLGSNRWVLSGAAHTNVQRIASGSVTLSGTLDRVRITTVNGTDTFDAGSINILYE